MTRKDHTIDGRPTHVRVLLANDNGARALRIFLRLILETPLDDAVFVARADRPFAVRPDRASPRPAVRDVSLP